MKSLSTKKAINGIAACFRNSKALLEDANILFDSKKYCRSFALSQFSIEEAGKSLILFEVYFKILIGKRNEIDFSEVSKNFKSHISKSLKTVLMEFREHPYDTLKEKEYDEFIKTITKEIDDSKTKYDKLKNQSLYVSYNNNNFFMPEDLFTKEVSKNHLLKAKQRLNICSGHITKYLSIISDANSNEKISLIKVNEALK